ncbi:hypothetical protein LTR95_011389 [Oleoguttula sp. CCFEE 5521]
MDIESLVPEATLLGELRADLEGTKRSLDAVKLQYEETFTKLRESMHDKEKLHRECIAAKAARDQCDGDREAQALIIQKLTSEISQLQAHDVQGRAELLKQYHSESPRLEQLLHLQAEENARTKKQERELAQRLSTAAQEVTESSEKHRIEIEHLSAGLRSATDEKTRMKDIGLDLTRQLENATDRAAQLSHQHRSELDAAASKFQSLTDENTRLNQAEANSTQQLTNAMNEIGELRSALDQTKSETASLQSEHGSFVELYAALVESNAFGNSSDELTGSGSDLVAIRDCSTSLRGLPVIHEVLLPMRMAQSAYEVLRRLTAEKYELCIGGSVQVILPGAPSSDVALRWQDSGMIWKLPSDDANDIKKHISPGGIVDRALSRFKPRRRQRGPQQIMDKPPRHERDGSSIARGEQHASTPGPVGSDADWVEEAIDPEQRPQRKRKTPGKGDEVGPPTSSIDKRNA